jgi:hypothetical protein
VPGKASSVGHRADRSIGALSEFYRGIYTHSSDPERAEQAQRSLAVLNKAAE